MELAEAIGFIRDAVGSTGGVWADLGAGDGTFTAALAEILGPGATIVAVDRDAAALDALDHLARAHADRATILPAHGDLAELGAIPELRGLVLDGAFFGNALHYLPDPGEAMADASARIRAGGRVIVVEYERATANPWVPHPLPVARLVIAARTAGLSSPEILARRPSQYQGEIYCALMRVPPTQSGRAPPTRTKPDQ